ncbi:hypothetical protein HDV04_002182 [Boothiomyces sp. JEL0838]|nr:hypothetical protein HDV04_002182 [Boothiomyces sp. JEL0838]
MISEFPPDLLECRIFYYLDGMDLYRISWLNKAMRNRMAFLRRFYKQIPPQKMWPELDLTYYKIASTLVGFCRTLDCKLIFPSIRVTLNGLLKLKLPRTSNLVLSLRDSVDRELLTAFNQYTVAGIDIRGEITYFDTLVYLLKTFPLKKLEITSFSGLYDRELDEIISVLPSSLEILKITMCSCESDYGPSDDQLYQLAKQMKNSNLRILNIQSHEGNLDPLIDIVNQLDEFICPYQSQSLETSRKLISILPSTKLKRLDVSIHSDMVYELLHAVRNSSIQHLHLSSDRDIDQYCKIIGENIHLLNLNHLAITAACSICGPTIGVSALETLLANLRNVNVFEITASQFEKQQFEVLVRYLPYLPLNKICLRGIPVYKQYLRCFTNIPMEF